MKTKSDSASGVQELCRKLKIQLDELAVKAEPQPPKEDEARLAQLMEQLKRQLADLST
ncbi:MAG: hypothetical protein KF799_09280 [Bdellovibrionales bacterium]|nr:hypothetical protein [Bdellovibrionales bacterium]